MANVPQGLINRIINVAWGGADRTLVIFTMSETWNTLNRISLSLFYGPQDYEAGLNNPANPGDGAWVISTMGTDEHDIESLPPNAAPDAPAIDDGGNITKEQKSYYRIWDYVIPRNPGATVGYQYVTSQLPAPPTVPGGATCWGEFGAIIVNVTKAISALKANTPPDQLPATLDLELYLSPDTSGAAQNRMRGWVLPVSNLKNIDMGPVNDTPMPRLNFDLPDLPENAISYWGEAHDTGFLNYYTLGVDPTVDLRISISLADLSVSYGPF